MKNINIDEKSLPIFEKYIPPYYKNWPAGTLLKIEARMSFTQIYEFKEGYPADPVEIVDVREKILNSKNFFMFLGWGTFDKWWRNDAAGKPFLVDRNNTNGVTMVGMIFFYRKLFFLTDGFSYKGEKGVYGIPSSEFLNRVLPAVRKLNL